MILKCNNGSTIAGKATKSSGTMENNHAYIWLLIVIQAIVVLEVKLKQLRLFFLASWRCFTSDERYHKPLQLLET